MTAPEILHELRDLLYDLERERPGGDNDRFVTETIRLRRQCEALRAAITLLEKRS